LCGGEKVDIVINCTGLGASKLRGVEDKTVVPARAQIIIVRNDAGKMIATSGTDDGDDEACYVMTRAAGGGTILGGCYQKGNWDSQVDPNLAVRIMKRAVAMCPSLTGGKGIESLDIVRHGVGLRPVREGGTRVERERISGVWVVHNYGAGGAGEHGRHTPPPMSSVLTCPKAIKIRTGVRRLLSNLSTACWALLRNCEGGMPTSNLMSIHGDV
jgi:D-amino-acid oxidase